MPRGSPAMSGTFAKMLDDLLLVAKKGGRSAGRETPAGPQPASGQLADHADWFLPGGAGQIWVSRDYFAPGDWTIGPTGF